MKMVKTKYEANLDRHKKWRGWRFHIVLSEKRGLGCPSLHSGRCRGGESETRECLVLTPG